MSTSNFTTEEQVLLTQALQPMIVDSNKEKAIKDALDITLGAAVDGAYLDFLSTLGYETPVPYEFGIELERTSQTVEYNGAVYFPLPEYLPFTTSGTFESTQFSSIENLSTQTLEARDEAVEAATTATTKAAEASDSADAAAGSADIAEGALGTLGIYADTTAGLAATTSGDYFSVPSAEDDEYLILYRNDSGSATAAKTYPAKGAIDALTELVEPEEKGDHLFAIADEFGNVILAVDAAGALVANFANVEIPSETDSSGTYDYEVNHIFTYGQSLSVGQATPVLSTAQNYDNLMFTRGMRPQYDYPLEAAGDWYASLVPAVEALSPENAALAETPNMGTGDMVKELILSEAGLAYTDHNYQLLLSSPGYGALTIAQLSKGTAHFTRMVTQAEYGLALANAAGKTYAVQAVTWTQGESDYLSGTTQAAYETSLGMLIADIQTDLKAETGQTKAIPVIGYQVASHKNNGVTEPNIALAQLAVEESNPLFYIATPMYHFPYQSDSNNHLTPTSSRWLGAYYGLAYKRIVIDGEDWKPVKPLSFIRQGGIVTIAFHVPHGPLVFDTTIVAENTDYGFELVEADGTPIAISSVEITGPATVKIIAGSTIPAGAKVRYAWTGSGDVGPTVGPRGNLRDSQGDSIIFDPDGINKPMHNWCVIFELEV